MLRTQINDALKAAMLGNKKVETATLRLIVAALRDRDIAVRGNGNLEEIGDEEILALLRSMVRQRRDSIELYEQGGRLELAEQERAEIAIIEGFLPCQMTREEVDRAVAAAIARLDASGLKDMGKVMGELKKHHAGRMDFGKASAMVKTKLAG